MYDYNYCHLPQHLCFIGLCFNRFMANLQLEVIELEFMEFSRGMKTISEVDFARVLLRDTNLDNRQKEKRLEQVRSNIPEEKVSFVYFYLHMCISYNFVYAELYSAHVLTIAPSLGVSILQSNSIFHKCCFMLLY